MNYRDDLVINEKIMQRIGRAARGAAAAGALGLAAACGPGGCAVAPKPVTPAVNPSDSATRLNALRNQEAERRAGVEQAGRNQLRRDVQGQADAVRAARGKDPATAQRILRDGQRTGRPQQKNEETTMNYRDKLVDLIESRRARLGLDEGSGGQARQLRKIAGIKKAQKRFGDLMYTSGGGSNPAAPSATSPELQRKRQEAETRFSATQLGGTMRISGGREAQHPKAAQRVPTAAGGDPIQKRLETVATDAATRRIPTDAARTKLRELVRQRGLRTRHQLGDKGWDVPSQSRFDPGFKDDR